MSAGWEVEVAELVERGLAGRDAGAPYLVAIAGPPGSGKTTGAAATAAVLRGRGIGVCVAPFDGFHLPMSALQRMPRAWDDWEVNWGPVPAVVLRCAATPGGGGLSYRRSLGTLLAASP